MKCPIPYIVLGKPYYPMNLLGYNFFGHLHHFVSLETACPKLLFSNNIMTAIVIGKKSYC